MSSEENIGCKFFTVMPEIGNPKAAKKLERHLKLNQFMVKCVNGKPENYDLFYKMFAN